MEVVSAENELVSPPVEEQSQKKKRKCCSCSKKTTTAVERPKQNTMALHVVLGRIPKKNRVYMVFGTIAAIALGAVMPLFTIIFGSLFNIFATQTPSEIRASSSIIAAIFVGLAVYNLVFGYLGSMLWGLVGEATGMYLRAAFFRALMQQEVGFFETESSTGALTQTLNADVEAVQSQTGGKMLALFQNISQIIIGIVIAFVYSWKLTLVLIAVSPLIALAAVLQGKLLALGATKTAIANQQISSLAIEVISGFRVVASFVWESEAERLLLDRLQSTWKSRIKAVHLFGAGAGFAMFCIFAVYSLGFWYGAQLVADTPANGGILVGDMLIVFFCVVSSAAALGQLTACLPDLAKARVAAYAVFLVVDRVSRIVSDSSDGVRDVELRGDVEFDSVRFAFPSRPDQLVLKGVSVSIAAGSVIGVVGSSGAGKSTLIALLERFHDPNTGTVKIDGRPIQDYNLKWLRRNIGLVSQEPKLFDASVAENILVGRPGATIDDVRAAAAAANAHTFICGLCDGYNTRVGEGGSQLSGGQKQRIAIARAMLKDPRIILLDEATSALDSESEATVQQALETLMKGRTTIVVAHRLSTIRNSDQILVMRSGTIAEQGRHFDLLRERGLYYGLVVRQMSDSERDELRASIKTNPVFKDDETN